MELMWKNIVGSGRPRMTIQYGACALHAAYLRPHTHTQYVILTAFPLQQFLQERATMLHLYVHCLLCISYAYSSVFSLFTLFHCLRFNLLDPELFFLVLAHSVYKMRIIQEPNTIEL